jgi:tRNA(adenine34) deaminase
MKKRDHVFFMSKALQQAQVALSKGEVPVGALVVDENGIIIGRGHNKIEQHNSQIAHAEVFAIQQASKKRGWRLDRCVIYVTLEPCLMCFGLIQQSRCAAVYFGASSPLYGYQSYQYQSSSIDNSIDQSVYKREIKIAGGLKELESVAILKAFFKQARCRGRRFNERASGVPQKCRGKIVEKERRSS